MFKKNENILNSLGYDYKVINDEHIHITIHNNDFCMCESMLCKLIQITLKELYCIVFKLMKENKIIINQNILYHVNSGSNASKLYKLKSENIDDYKANIQGEFSEDDEFELVFSSEAIIEIFEVYKFIEKEKFIEYAKKCIDDSYKFNFFVQGIICGVDDSILKIDFGNNLKVCPMKMPENNNFLRLYWYVLDVFSFDNRFVNAIINKSDGRINTIVSDLESAYIDEYLDENDNNILEKTDIEMIEGKVNRITWTFKLIRLVSKKTIWCSELIRQISSGAFSAPNIIEFPKPYNYKKNEMSSLCDEEADKINKLINIIPNLNDTILELTLKNYDYSFYVPDDVAIVLLVTCLEILFHPGDRDELKNRVARNAAVFLGNDIKSSSEIFDTIKIFYDIRSALVHTGKYKDKKSNKSKEEIINDLRSIVSESIINYSMKISKNNITRSMFMNTLNKSGFDSKPY